MQGKPTYEARCAEEKSKGLHNHTVPLNGTKLQLTCILKSLPESKHNKSKTQICYNAIH